MRVQVPPPAQRPSKMLRFLTSRKNLSDLTTSYILWGIPVIYFSVVVCFYLRTYDSAQVKITLTQMGIAAVFGLWLMEKVQNRRLSLSLDYLPVYAPFFAILASGVFSFFVQAPFKWVSLDDFIRRALYMSVALVVFDKLRGLIAVERVLKFLLLGLFCSCFYGLIQFLDSRIFPPNPDLGIDIFIWRQAFGPRIFSTFGNPNFFGDYMVLMFPIVFSWALAKRSFAAWCLVGLALFNVLFTETKGAWLGLIMTMVIWAFFYSLYILEPLAQMIRKRLWAIFAIGISGFFMLLALTPSINQASIPFRLYTWLSTYEMIRAHPVAGTGIGSFKVVYSGYRRPTIFHIEGKHNTETDHAENEHIEVVFDEGIFGFGIYLWLILTVIILSVKTLRRWRDGGCRDARPYYLVGVLVGWLGSLFHNNFDVSIRFVSSGIFMGLLPALAANLALSDRIWREEEPRPMATALASSAPRGRGAAGTDLAAPLWHSIILGLAKFASLLAAGYATYVIFGEFYEIQQKMLGSSHPGDRLMVLLAWLFFVVLLGGGLYMYARALHAARSIFASLAPALLVYPMLFFWGWFRGDVHHNIAIVHSKNRDWNNAIANYREVIKRNPGFIMAYYFLGNVFNDRWDMELKNMPLWGDAPGVKRRDFERALEIYEGIKENLAPNYVQMHYHVGNLFLKRAQWGRDSGESPETANGFYEEAVRRYYAYQRIDPVFEDNYYRLGYALSRLGRFQEAQQEFKKLILAYKCQDLTEMGHLNSLIHWSKWAGHGHPEPQAYMNLANAYLMAGDYSRAVRTYEGFLRRIDPQNNEIRQQLYFLMQQKAEIMRRIEAMRPTLAPASSYGIERSRIDQ